MMSGEASRVLGRVSAGLLGGYAFTWGFAALGIAGLVALGVDFHEAEKAVLMLALLVFLGVFLWAFAAASLARVWAVVAGATALMSAAAWGLTLVLV
jgi:glucan phosphoethanolaminetransferase (alkaline phosphatase superfamily)